MHPGHLAFRIQYKKAIFCIIFCKKPLLNQFFLSKFCKKPQGVFFQNKAHQTCQNSSFNLVIFFTAHLKAELLL